MIPSSIQNIIFDLGGVILHLDPQRTFDSLARLGDLDTQEFRKLYQEFPLFLSYERGGVACEEFIQGMRSQLGKENLSDAALIDGWNAMLLHFPPENLELLRRLKAEGRYRLFLLSNTNVLHIEEVHRRLHKTCGEADFTNYFEKVYYSQDIGARKPEPEAYQIILDEHGLKPEETLFIDDNEPNLLGAARLGIQTYHFPQNGDLPALFAHGSRHA